MIVEKLAKTTFLLSFRGGEKAEPSSEEEEEEIARVRDSEE